MKPEHSRHHLKSVGIARARMFLKGHLDWLDGVPVSQSAGRIEWKLRPQVGAPRPDTIVVDRDLLRRSQTVLGKLSKHFPAAMRKLVGDVEEWSRNVTAMLDRLKEAIYGGTDLLGNDAVPVETLSRHDRILVGRLLRESPLLAPVLRIVIWSGWYDGQAREFLLTWVDNNASWIQEHLQVAGVEPGLTTVLLAGDVARQDGDVAEQLIQSTLVHSDAFRTVTSGLGDEISWFVKRLQDWRNPKSHPSRPRVISETPQGVRISSFFHWLAAQPQPVRQRAARLATLTLSNDLVQQWRLGWEKYHAAAHTAIRGLCQQVKNQLSNTAFHSEACRVSHVLEQELGKEPSPYSIAEILSNIQRISTDRSPRFHRALWDLLSSIPIHQADADRRVQGTQFRLAFLDEAAEINIESRGVLYFELAARFQQTCVESHRMWPWFWLILSTTTLKRCRWSSPRSSLFDELPNQSQWADYFTLLSRVVNKSGYSYSVHDRLAWLLRCSKDVEQAELRFSLLAAAEQLDFTCEHLETAIELESDDFSLAEAIERVSAKHSISTLQLQSIRKLQRHFAEAGWPKVIQTLLRTNQLKELLNAAMHLQLAISSEEIVTPVRPDMTSVVPEWANRLPVALQQQIVLSLAAFPDSRARIQRVLNKHFPDHEQLQSEIEMLEQLQCRHQTDVRAALTTDESTSDGSRVPPHIRQQRRLQNLRQRLNNPVLVAESTVIELQQKLYEVLMLDLFRHTAGRLSNGLARSLGVTDSRPPLLPMRYLELIRGILDLNAPYRALGLRLLKKCWGDEDWDPREEPRNRRFAEKVIARGIRIEPWLSDRVRHIAGTEQHPPLRLSFETNEAEKLLMGYYFGTCLSPGDCNFYSTIANSIDINKQVLYARDPKGDVVGRCLLAIGDAGALVVFRPYCHDNTKYEWSALVTQFVTELANEMGTVVSHTDHVSPLVSPEWYDDGAYNLGNSVAAEDSPLRTALKQASESDLISLLETALAPTGLNESMLELIVQLPELKERPELVRPLLPLMATCEQRLGRSSLVAFAMLAHRAEMRDIASRLLKQYAPNWICRRMHHGGYYESEQALIALIEYHPSAALRVLRETRARTVNCDADEFDTDRRQLLSKCFEALGRQKPAQAMLRRYEAKRTRR